MTLSTNCAPRSAPKVSAASDDERIPLPVRMISALPCTSPESPSHAHDVMTVIDCHKPHVLGGTLDWPEASTSTSNPCCSGELLWASLLSRAEKLLICGVKAATSRHTRHDVKGASCLPFPLALFLQRHEHALVHHCLAHGHVQMRAGGLRSGECQP